MYDLFPKNGKWTFRFRFNIFANILLITKTITWNSEQSSNSNIFMLLNNFPCLLFTIIYLLINMSLFWFALFLLFFAKCIINKQKSSLRFNIKSTIFGLFFLISCVPLCDGVQVRLSYQYRSAWCLPLRMVGCAVDRLLMMNWDMTYPNT